MVAVAVVLTVKGEDETVRNSKKRSPSIMMIT
jgi:hypothetical protein